MSSLHGAIILGYLVTVIGSKAYFRINDGSVHDANALKVVIGGVGGMVIFKEKRCFSAINSTSYRSLVILCASRATLQIILDLLFAVVCMVRNVECTSRSNRHAATVTTLWFYRTLESYGVQAKNASSAPVLDFRYFIPFVRNSPSRSPSFASTFYRW